MDDPEPELPPPVRRRRAPLLLIGTIAAWGLAIVAGIGLAVVIASQNAAPGPRTGGSGGGGSSAGGSSASPRPVPSAPAGSASAPAGGGSASPSTSSAPSPSVANPTSSNGTSPSPGATAVIHLVAEGENLTRIARRYGVSVAAIVEANGLPDADQIEVGQSLMIPIGAGPAPASATPTTDS